MSPIFVISIILAALIILLGVVVLKSGYKKQSNRIFFILVLIVSAWQLIYTISSSPSIYSIYIIRLTNIFGLLMAILFTIFTLIYPKNDFPRLTRVISIISLALFILFVPIIIFSPYIISDIMTNSNIILPVSGNFAWSFLSLISLLVAIGFFILLFKFFRKYKSNLSERKQLSYVLLGIGVTAGVILFNNLLNNMFGNKVSILFDLLTPFSVIFFIFFTAYGILRGGLFDVRMAVVRSVTYAMVIATLAGLYTVTTLVLSSLFRLGDSSPIELVSNVFISLVLVFLFQPLRRFFDRITNKIFYKDNYDTDDFFGRVNKILAITTDLKDLLRKTSLEISKTLKASQAFFYILTDNGKIGAAGTAESSTLAEADLLNIFSYASKKGQITVATLLEDNDPVKKLLSDNKIEIALPLMKGKKLVGLFLMGENMSSNYTGRDISVLETLSNGLVVAILNALAVQEIRDFNVTLRQKIDEATKELRVKNAMLKKLDKAKDEFVSMASHQLRTPLTSVKGYLSMVVDGDAGKVTKQQKELLDEAYVSNEKMVNLVNDFLNVSRIQTGKFMLEKLPIDLSKLVDQEVKGLVQNAKKRGIKLAYRADKNIPSLMVDEGKIRQVVMNYIDNAIYYSHQDSTIKIDLVIDKDEIVFTVKDTGIGVPISEQAGLFTKFYRASNAKKQRPDGTGVGLYLAKKIVSAHDGKIIFKTVEGQGSTFGFSLPIKELKV